MYAVAQSCLTLCDPKHFSLSGSSVLAILQTRTLEWFAISFFGESSQPRDGTCVACTDRQILHHLSHHC